MRIRMNENEKLKKKQTFLPNFFDFLNIELELLKDEFPIPILVLVPLSE
jgi:hypothetical protein